MLRYTIVNRRFTNVCLALSCAILCGAFFTSPLTATESLAAPATMAQFWSGESYFTHVSSFKTPSSTPVFRSEAFNVDQTIVADAGDTWYMFHCELFTVDGQSICPAEPFRSRIIVRTTTDKGLNWSPRDPIAEPGKEFCQYTDGDVYYDAAQNEWHALYQCLQTTADGGRWAVCHATKSGLDPVGGWIENPANPVVRNQEFFTKLGYPDLFDEGTPDIVEKNAGGSFHVTIHGIEPVSGGVINNGILAVARVSNNFTTWEPINSGPIFSAADTTLWQVPWEFTLRGGGFASTIKESAYYYTIIESSDINVGITANQNWAHGLMRRTSITQIGGENAAENPIISSKRQTLFFEPGDNPAVGAVAYPRLFKDAEGVIYLMYGADRVTGRDSADPVAGHHLFKLTPNAPLLDFTFRAGPRDSDPYFVRTDTVSRGRGDALGYRVTLSETSDGTHAVRFNQSDARISLLGNPYLMTEAGFRMVLDLTIEGLPTGSNRSARIAGQPGSFWLELYQNADLCFWAVTSGNQPEAACLNAADFIGSAVKLSALYNRPTGDLTLILDDQEQTINLPPGAALVGDGKRFLIGSAGAIPEGFYASPNMTLQRLRFYDQATKTDAPDWGEYELEALYTFGLHAR